MPGLQPISADGSPGERWRLYVLGAIVFGSLAFLLTLQPFGQPSEYHNFADRRTFFGIPNFLDVVSNLPFLLVGVFGLRYALRNRIGDMQSAWITLFAGVAFVSLGSAFYHWTPTNTTLVWDRLPMTIGFMGLFAAFVGEYVDERLGSRLLIPAVLIGLGSVLYWYLLDDLRVYVWVQALPLLSIPVLMVLYRPQYSHQWLLLVGFGLYALAKGAELFDTEILALTGSTVSGHSIKHLIAALSVYAVYWMVTRRERL
jgi:hypothetical protein